MTGMLQTLLKYLLPIKRRFASKPCIARIWQQVVNETVFTSLYIHERMLADKMRVDSYYAAIQKHVKEGDIVVDLGTGTGILSFFASLKHPKKIYALDHSNIIEIAKTVAKHNNIPNIQFIKGYSQNITLSEKADVIIQEQMSSWLFDHNMVECVIDLRDRVLKTGGKILPGKFELFIEPVKIKDEYQVPLIWEQHIRTIDFQCLKQFKNELEKKGHYYRTIRPSNVEHFLSNPEPILSFDLETLSSVHDLPHVLKSDKVILNNGRLDGFCLYFRAIFDDDIILDISPMGRDSFHASWWNAFYAVESENVVQKDVIELRINIRDIIDIHTWQWNHQIRSHRDIKR